MTGVILAGKFGAVNQQLTYSVVFLLVHHL